MKITLAELERFIPNPSDEASFGVVVFRNRDRDIFVGRVEEVDVDVKELAFGALEVLHLDIRCSWFIKAKINWGDKPTITKRKGFRIRPWYNYVKGIRPTPFIMGPSLHYSILRPSHEHWRLVVHKVNTGEKVSLLPRTAEVINEIIRIEKEARELHILP